MRVYIYIHVNIYIYIFICICIYTCIYIDGLSAVMSLRVRDLGFVEIMAYKPKRGKVQG